jgi:hypothetical protein
MAAPHHDLAVDHRAVGRAPAHLLQLRKRSVTSSSPVRDYVSHLTAFDKLARMPSHHLTNGGRAQGGVKEQPTV